MGEADTIRRVRVNEDRMARGADDVSAGRVVLRDDAREGQHQQGFVTSSARWVVWAMPGMSHTRLSSSSLTRPSTLPAPHEARDRWFESGSLQRRISNKLGVRA